MVVLVIGGKGQLGQAIQHVAKDYPEISFFLADSTKGDITNIEKLHELFAEVNPAFCINAAAYTAVDKAESEPEKAEAINFTGAKNLAEVCRDTNTILIHISTDFVFDGEKSSPYNEQDQTNPQGQYGITKLLGERAVAETFENYYIIRTSWLYSEFGNNFMKTMLRLSKERDSISVVNDQTGTPTQAVDLAKAIASIILSDKKQYGIYHFSNEGFATWYDFAKYIFEKNNVSIELKPIPTEQFPTPAKRPSYSVMDKSKIKATFGIEIRNWKDAI